MLKRGLPKQIQALSVRTRTYEYIVRVSRPSSAMGKLVTDEPRHEVFCGEHVAEDRAAKKTFREGRTIDSVFLSAWLAVCGVRRAKAKGIQPPVREKQPRDCHADAAQSTAPPFEKRGDARQGAVMTKRGFGTKKLRELAARFRVEVAPRRDFSAGQTALELSRSVYHSTGWRCRGTSRAMRVGRMLSLQGKAEKQGRAEERGRSRAGEGKHGEGYHIYTTIDNT